MNLQPTLIGSRVTLRPLTLEDFNDLYQVASDPLIWDQHSSPLRYQPDEFKKFFNEAMASGGALLILDQKTNQPIGCTRYYDYDASANTIVIGYTFLSRAYWGGGYNREIKKLMLFHAYRFVKEVFFHVSTENFRSQRALKKIGGYVVETRSVQMASGDFQTRLIYRVSLQSAESL